MIINREAVENKQSMATKTHCQHLSLIQEFAYGVATGNYICIHCESLIPARMLADNLNKTSGIQFPKNIAYSAYLSNGF
jgi:hypothetical protein